MAEKPSKQISRVHPFITGGILLDIAWLATISIAYILAVQVGFLFKVQPAGVAAIWPPSGVALAALLLSVRRKWVLVLLVVFTTNTSEATGYAAVA